MALGDPYATLSELKQQMGIEAGDEYDDDRLTRALLAATREIETWCRRQFNRADTATPRLYTPRNARCVRVDDFWTTDDLQVATGPGYGTVWTSSDYRVEPLGGIVDGQPGWPYSRIVGVGRTFAAGCGPTLQVTARWGWDEVPEPVRDACLILAAESFKLGDAPFGVAGFGDYGPVRLRMNSVVQTKLAPYRRDPVLVG